MSECGRCGADEPAWEMCSPTNCRFFEPIASDESPRATLREDERARVDVAVHVLLFSDAMTGNHDGTPEHYIVDAENVEYLVRVVLDAADSADANRVAAARAAGVAQGKAEAAAAIRAGFVAWDALGEPHAPHPLHSGGWLVERAYETAARIAEGADQ